MLLWVYVMQSSSVAVRTRAVIREQLLCRGSIPVQKAASTGELQFRKILIPWVGHDGRVTRAWVSQVSPNVAQTDMCLLLSTPRTVIACNVFVRQYATSRDNILLDKSYEAHRFGQNELTHEGLQVCRWFVSLCRPLCKRDFLCWSKLMSGLPTLCVSLQGHPTKGTCHRTPIGTLVSGSRSSRTGEPSTLGLCIFCVAMV